MSCMDMYGALESRKTRRKQIVENNSPNTTRRKY